MHVGCWNFGRNMLFTRRQHLGLCVEGEGHTPWLAGNTSNVRSGQRPGDHTQGSLYRLWGEHSTQLFAFPSLCMHRQYLLEFIVATSKRNKYLSVTLLQLRQSGNAAIRSDSSSFDSLKAPFIIEMAGFRFLHESEMCYHGCTAKVTQFYFDLLLQGRTASKICEMGQCMGPKKLRTNKQRCIGRWIREKNADLPGGRERWSNKLLFFFTASKTAGPVP